MLDARHLLRDVFPAPRRDGVEIGDAHHDELVAHGAALGGGQIALEHAAHGAEDRGQQRQVDRREVGDDESAALANIAVLAVSTRQVKAAIIGALSISATDR